MKKNLKILLVGITGDLSKKKVLPAIAEYAEKYKESVDVDLIGFSRSMPDMRKINLLLDRSSKLTFHSLRNVENVQGDYNDAEYFNDVISSIQENQELVIYLAVPPEVFVRFLQNSCPFNTKPFHIIIEKPFGRDSQEAQKIMNILGACDLKNQVNFFDHYLFKNSTICGREFIENAKFIQNKKIKSVKIKALESLGVQGRKGYYDTAGAIKDMLPHLYSLMDLALSSIESGKNFSIFSDFENKYKIENLVIAQYSDYLKDLEIESSETETYFKTEFKIYNSEKEEIKVELESGKMLEKKETQIQVIFENGECVFWNINPQQDLFYRGMEDPEVNYQPCEDGVSDHARLFENIIEHEKKHFVNLQNIEESWVLYDLVKKFQEADSVKLKKYETGQKPE